MYQESDRRILQDKKCDIREVVIQNPIDYP